MKECCCLEKTISINPIIDLLNMLSVSGMMLPFNLLSLFHKLLYHDNLNRG